MTDQALNLGTATPALLRRLFSTRVLRQLAQGVVPPEVERITELLATSSALPSGTTLADIFEASYRHSVRSQRSEYAYKNAIVQRILLGKYSLGTAAANFEVRIGSSKLDVLLAREHLTAFEIKTERDELGRLASQIEQYRKACRHVWILTSERHAKVAEKLLPATVGIAVLTSRHQVSSRRAAVSDRDALDSASLLRLLRKREMVSLLKGLGADPKNVPNTKLFSTLLDAAQSESLEGIEKYVAAALLKRSAPAAALLRRLPNSVAACALAMDLTTPQAERLISAFNADVTGESLCLPITHTFGESSTN